MRVSFIGMSNIGKSYWARRMSALEGCPHIDCDALIEKKLGSELSVQGYTGLRGIAKWMGFPADAQYGRNSQLYQKYEQEVMQETIDFLRAEPTAPAVIDTTGSVIYTDDGILEGLRQTTRVIYFEASEAHIATLFRRYIANPKPVIWDDIYEPEFGEEPRETLKRCYPLLLQERAERYKALAHFTIPYEQHKNREVDICALIRKQAKK